MIHDNPPAHRPALASPHSFERIPLREVRLQESTLRVYREFLAVLHEKLDADADRNIVCREALRELHTGRSGLREIHSGSAEPPLTENVLFAHYDPRNVILEAERYGEVDVGKFAAVKPLLWLWYCFDRTPLGLNLDFGFRMRELLAKYIFRRCGQRPRIFPYCEFSFGYNIELGDDVVIHRGVTLDDRAGIIIGNRSSMSDFAAVFSHSHDVNEQELVSNHTTIIEDDCRITYHATILAGSTIRKGSLV